MNFRMDNSIQVAAKPHRGEIAERLDTNLRARGAREIFLFESTVTH
jgi:hypothetical protein